MAEKRGQYIYLEDGSIAQLVYNVGDESEAGSTLPFDHQATLVNTAVTHTGQVVPNGTSNAQATWQPVPEGMSEVITNLLVDLAAANVYTNILWSEDGTNASGKTLQTILATNGAAQKTSTQWFPVGGAFYKVEIQNSDAAPRTCSANIKFRP